MKAVILAAGMGIRLRPMTETLPKGLVEINNKTLLERSLDALNENNITEAIIVTGFYGDSIKARIGETYKNIKISYATNNRFFETGSMFSLSQIKHLIGNESILVLESDLIYEARAISEIIKSELNDAILTSELLNSGDDVYICTNEEGDIINLGKNIPESDMEKVSGALVGISKYSPEFLAKLFQKAEEDYQNKDLNYHYEECVFATSQIHQPVKELFCSGLNWIEIDNEVDLKRAKEHVYPKIVANINKDNPEKSTELVS